MPDLTLDLEYLDRLNGLRSRAKELRNLGLRALVERDPAASEDWDDVTSTVTHILLRRAKHLAWDLGNDATMLSTHFGELPEITLLPKPTSGGTPPSVVVPGPDFDDTWLFIQQDDPRAKYGTPVFMAASYMRARLDELPASAEPEKAHLAHVPEDFFRCFYRVLREIFTIQFPEWCFGGAEASVGGDMSLFVSAECCRAVGYFATIAEGTGRFLERVAEVKSYVDLIGRNRTHPETPLDETWCDTEIARVSESIRSLARASSARCLLRLDKLEGEGNKESCAGLLNRIQEMAIELICESKAAMERACLGIAEFRNDAEALGDRDRDLSETAHRVSYQTLVKACARLNDMLSHPASPEMGSSEWLKSVANGFAEGARDIRGMLNPMYRFMEGRLHKYVFDVESGGMTSGLQDMAFAAVTSALAPTADRARGIYVRAFEILCRSIDEQGRLPAGNPFHTQYDGAERHAANAHSLRAFAQLAQHVPRRIDPVVVERMLRYFERQAQPLRGRDGVGWQRSGVRAVGRLSLWVTAASVMTLNRIVAMLDTKINACLSEHFTTVQAKPPAIDAMMCTDLGLASVKWGETQHERRTVTHDLELLRANLVSRRPQIPPPNQRLHSLILYGPPGTGKTTLAEALACSSEVDLVRITPSDLVIQGSEGLERRAKAVMSALSMYTRVVILFDEFDAVIHTRSASIGHALTELPDDESGVRNHWGVVPRDTKPRGMFEFLTGSMLPRLSELSKAAIGNGFVYILATNYIDDLDQAAIRPGRFELKRGVYPSDVASRMCRMVSEIEQWKAAVTSEANPDPIPHGEDWKIRLLEVIARTAQVPMAQLCRVGWYQRPRGRELPLGSAWHYIIHGGAEPNWPMPGALGWDEPRRDDHRYKNTIEIDHDTEMELVDAWNHILLEVVDDTKGTATWKDALVAIQNYDTAPHAADWLKRREQVKNRRIYGRRPGGKGGFPTET